MDVFNPVGGLQLQNFPNNKFVQACIVCRKVVGGDYKFVQACVIL